MKTNLARTGHLKGILANKTAIKNMDTKSIAKILDSLKKDYQDQFGDTVSSLPIEMLPSVISSLSYKTRIELLRTLEVDFVYSIFEFANNDEVASILEDLEQADEGKFKKVLEKLKLENSSLLENNSNPHHAKLANDDFGIKIYLKIKDKIVTINYDETSSPINLSNVVWVDMYKPSADEIELAEKLLGIEIPTINEREEIEVSSRYWEENGVTTINSYFTIYEDDEVVSETISLILKDNFIVSVRFRNLLSFEELNKRMVLTPYDFDNGIDALLTLLDIRIDLDADMLEKLVKEIATLRKHFIKDSISNDHILNKLSSLEDLNIKMRESLQDKSRILNSFIKNKQLTEVQVAELRIMIKDVGSLITHVDFNFERVDSIQNVALASISIKQGKNITILTIANILFLPPTLIASLYGMNFEFMPELNWEYGYAYAITLMIVSAIAPYWLFKKKGLL